MDPNIKPIKLDTGHEPKKKKKKKSLVYLFSGLGIVVVIVLLIAGFLAYNLMPLKTVYAKGQVLIASARTVADSIKNQDIDAAKAALADTRTKLDDVKSEYKKVEKLSSFPFLGVYVQDGNHMLSAATHGMDAADSAIQALEPNADLLGFKGGSKFVEGTTDQRIQTAVKTMKALTPKINEMAESIDKLQKEIDMVDPTRYPEHFKGVEVRKQMTEAFAMIDSSANLFVNAQPLLTSIPDILGDEKMRRYLILFQNDKELRPTGGFLTAFALFEVNKGKIDLIKSDDIYTLDAARFKILPAPAEIKTYHINVNTFNIRDSNLSPDFKVSMAQFEELYEMTSGRVQFDGIIAMDTHVLVEALKILGPTYVYGREFSSENDSRCDCPRAVYELEDYATRPVNYVRETRKDIIGVLMREILLKALGYSPSQYWGKLFQMMIDEVNQKHILAYFKDEGEQIAVEKFNMAGRIMTAKETAPILKYTEGVSWDYLHINNANMAGQKANMFVSDEVTKDTIVNTDGTITTKLTIDYKNPYPGSDCNLESGGLCLNAPLRNWVRVYVPKGSTLVTSKGSQSPSSGKSADMKSYDSLEKTVFEGFIVVNPKGIAKLELEYTSPVTAADGYKLLIQKQPGTTGSQWKLLLNGKTREEFTLDTDTEFSY